VKRPGREVGGAVGGEVAAGRGRRREAGGLVVLRLLRFAGVLRL